MLSRMLAGALLISAVSVPATYTPTSESDTARTVVIQVADPATLLQQGDCITINEFGNVEEGMTRDHVQDDIFDGYTGQFVTETAEGWRLRAYDACDGEHEAYVFYGDGDLRRVKDKNWHIK